jgi:hypothetical protein
MRLSFKQGQRTSLTGCQAGDGGVELRTYTGMREPLPGGREGVGMVLGLPAPATYLPTSICA